MAVALFNVFRLIRKRAGGKNQNPNQLSTDIRGEYEKIRHNSSERYGVLSISAKFSRNILLVKDVVFVAKLEFVELEKKIKMVDVFFL
jgi:hypothetical protein